MIDSLERPHPPAPPCLAEVPTHATGLQLLGEMAGSGYRQPPLLVRRVDGQTMQLTPLLYRVLEAIDGRRDHIGLAEVVSDRMGRLLLADDIRFLVEAKLGPLGVLRSADGTEPATVKANPLLGLRFRFMITNPRVTQRLTAPFAWLFHPGVVVSAMVAFALTSWWVLFHKGLGTAVDEALYQPRLILVLVTLIVVSAAFHELGHAAACRRGGATPGAMGAALYLVWPVFYTDVTDSYRLGRGGRLRVDFGGLYFNAIFTLATVGVWALVREDPLLMMVPVQLLQMVRQLVPLVRFDGYHILADLVGVPDLFGRIKPILLSMVPGRRRPCGPNPLKPWARVVVSGWVVLVVPVLALTFGLAVWTLPQLATSAWGSLGLQADALRINVSDRNLDRIALGLVSIVAVALLPASMAYLTARIVRVSSMRLWIASEGHPVPRGLAMAVVVALVATTGSQWWPDRGTEAIQQAGPAAPSDVRPMSTGQVVKLQGPVGATLASGPETTDRPAPAAPPRPAPAPDQVLDRDRGHVHSSGDGAATVLPASAPERPARAAWPFPFAPPPGPGAGDNFALAVNTVDGTSVVDSAFSLQWLPAGPLKQINRADALASCVDCTTVAVAFQVLIADGLAEPAIPQNLAVAANSECNACLTRAVAVQLVVALETLPSDEARDQIATWWDRLGALERDAEHLSPEEIHAQLLVIRAAILEILAPYGDALPLKSDIAGHTSDAALEGLDSSSPAPELLSGTLLPDPSDDPLAGTQLVDGGAAGADDAVGKDEVADGKSTAIAPPVEEAPIPEEVVFDDQRPVGEQAVPEEQVVDKPPARAEEPAETGETTTTKKKRAGRKG